MNPMQNGQQNQYQMHSMSQQRMMGMGNMQHMNQYQMGMNNMNNMSQMQQMNTMQMNQMMMRQQQQNQQTQQQRYNNYRSNAMQSNMQPNMRSNMQQTMSMNMQQSTNRSNHNSQSSNQHNSATSNNQSSNNNANNANKGPTKDTWISPFKNRDQNIDFFMYAYKCQPCPLRRNCQSKVTCPGWHHEGEKRRNPGEDPNFLYSEEPCPNVKPQGSNKWQPPSRCTDGDECGYSHTLLEQMYHPNIYKTSMCINFTNPQGNKCQWGFYCTHAHGQEDIRNPNKKQSASNDKVNAEDSNTPTNKDKTGSANATASNKASTNTTNTPTKPIAIQPPAASALKKDKRARSQSDAPTLYNGGHLRSPPFDTMGMTQSHGSRPHMMPQYNSYASYNGAQHNNSSNNLANNTSPSRVRPADFSPLPYQVNNAKAYAQNPPPLHLHNDNNAMYPHHTQHDYYAQQSHMSYHQTQNRKRSMSAGLVPYMPPSKSSQQPNIPGMYHHNKYHTHTHSHDPMQYSSHTAHHTSQPPTEDIPTNMHPTLDASARMSRTFNTTKTAQNPPNTAAANTTTNPPVTPPPPSAKQAKNSSHHFLNGDINFYDPSGLQPRPMRSMSAVGDGAHDVANNPYLPNPAVIQNKLTKMGKLQASSSLPSYAYPNKVPPLPGQENSTAASKGYYFKETPIDPSQIRHRSESEPLLLPPLPNGQYNMVSPSIWRTGPNQEAPTSSSNPNKADPQTTNRGQKPGSDPFSSQKRLTSIPDVPDHNARGHAMMSPNALNIDHIMTPRDMISPDGQIAQQQNEADWNYFGFNKEDVQGVMSPIPDPKDMKKKIDVPPTPTPPLETVAVESKKVHKKRIGTKVVTAASRKIIAKERGNKDEQIKRLKRDLEVATHQIQVLNIRKNASIPSMESGTKKSERVNTVKPNDDEKESENNSAENKQEWTEIQKQQLLRYKHFITCPSCKQFDPKAPRNQVLIPCGHLVCSKCSSQTQDNHLCPVCNDTVENYQLLLIG